MEDTTTMELIYESRSRTEGWVRRAGGMHVGHPKWQEFCDTLAGPFGCNFTEDGRWTCKGGMDKSFAYAILRGMGFEEEAVKASMAYFDAHGGHCDCEILFNVTQHGDPG